MRGTVEESLTWRERLFSWPWRPWIGWRRTEIEGELELHTDEQGMPYIRITMPPAEPR